MKTPVAMLAAAGLLVLPALPAAAETSTPEPPPAALAQTAADESPTERPFQLGWSGYLRGGYEWVQNDPDFDQVGENSGFVLQTARIQIDGAAEDHGFSFRISMDAADVQDRALNNPMGQLDVSLRDGWLRQELHPTVGLQVGQFKAPFLADELVARHDQMFASRAVGTEGVLPGRGLERRGIAQGRQLGAMFSPAEPIRFGDFGVAYALAVMNGNGANRTVNDNNSLAYYGRLELLYDDMVRLGASVLHNQRRIGDLPNRFDETDFGLAADLQVRVEGLLLQGQFARITRSLDTLGAEDEEKLAWHVQARYLLDMLPVHIAPGYRLAFYDPRADLEDASAGPADFGLLYHTVGLQLHHPALPVSADINYTLTMEDDAAALDNDRFELILQVLF